MIDQDHTDFAAIIRVNRAGRVQHGDPVLQGEPRARTNLRLMARRQRDREPGRHQRALSGGQNQRSLLRHRGQQIEARGMGALIGRQRQAFAMGQLPDLDFDRGTHEVFPTVWAIRATNAAATCSLDITGQESTWISAPSRVSKWTVLRSPPITPVACEMSLATIQSQPLRVSFALALSIRCSVSAANPMTKAGRLSFCSFEIVARISGFSTSCSGGIPAEVFFSFCSPALATRQSATAAAKIAISTGSAASTCCSMSRADSTGMTDTPEGWSRSTGPEIKVTSAPAACAAAAMA